MENKTLMTDFYELTMAQTYFMEGKADEEVYFDVFFRKNPFEGGYTVSAGLDETIKYIKNFHFGDEEIEYLRGTGKFREDFLDYLKILKFKGNVYATVDGEIVFPNEPVITVKADIVTAQLLETAILANFNHGSLVATATRRIVNEAGDIPVMEFGARRARGIDSAVEASKCSYISGACGTSNTLAGMKYGIPVLGTMAHSLITEADDEYEAFLKYAKANPDNCVFLVDTYDTLRSGVVNAIRVADDYLKPNGFKFKGIRIDSGDLAYLSKEARKMLDEAGYGEATICLSNGLNEHTIRDLLNQGAKIDSLGVGDNIAASKERVGGVYKLVAVCKNGEIVPKIKVSNERVKITNPGYKKVYRFFDKESGYALGDVICLAEEKIPMNGYTLVHSTDTWKQKNLQNYEVRELQKEIFRDGELVYVEPSILEKREYAKKAFDEFYPEVTRVNKPHGYYVDLSNKLRELKNALISFYTRTDTNEEKGIQKVKVAQCEGKN